jgi:hypothetical protein
MIDNGIETQLDLVIFNQMLVKRITAVFPDQGVLRKIGFYPIQLFLAISFQIFEPHFRN